ncbi:hypothetical protein DSCO28_50710 [Desulfosarcina ovata subsp. sediminis]|uniref:Uncharacterized protein n=1 Tax=Desulfosarcina ovata subsp. sediminis TaxID=885957 RepID=A0A5K7ZW67_9BACT|nr:hypothetical protein [Desulfosarcina ovata]BBO84505.1 hypothetical protein DSCO28_50710 [Desulfosarcina ovata subsp. sediminis]
MEINPTGMTDVSAWTPIQDPASMGAGITRSMCLGCKHVAEDKNVCRAREDCPIRITNYPLSSMCNKKGGRKSVVKKTGSQKRGVKKGYKYKGDGVCQFPGCNEPIKRGKYCTTNGHSQIVANRKRAYPNNPEKWLAPINRKESR